MVNVFTAHNSHVVYKSAFFFRKSHQTEQLLIKGFQFSMKHFSNCRMVLAVLLISYVLLAISCDVYIVSSIEQ